MPIRTLRLPLLGAVSLIALFGRSMPAQDATSVSSQVVPAGTIFLIQLSDQLDTRTVKAGDPFQARLAESLVTASGQTIASGKKIKGHVSAVQPGLRMRLILSFDEIETTRGWVPLIATVTGVPGEHGLRQIGDEGEIGRRGMTKEQIAEAIVVGAGKGAAEGEESGGKRGAAAGAGSGAAQGAVSAFESGHALILEKGTALEIRLDRNLGVPTR
ncbi:MAG TPA: hypothetical protein VIH75_18165 [Candidatus Sulfotelmatobacter sp.]|jgi:hypothetical protein